MASRRRLNSEVNLARWGSFSRLHSSPMGTSRRSKCGGSHTRLSGQHTRSAVSDRSGASRNNRGTSSPDNKTSGDDPLFSGSAPLLSWAWAGHRCPLPPQFSLPRYSPVSSLARQRGPERPWSYRQALSDKPPLLVVHHSLFRTPLATGSHCYFHKSNLFGDHRSPHSICPGSKMRSPHGCPHPRTRLALPSGPVCTSLLFRSPLLMKPWVVCQGLV